MQYYYNQCGHRVEKLLFILIQSMPCAPTLMDRCKATDAMWTKKLADFRVTIPAIKHSLKSCWFKWFQVEEKIWSWEMRKLSKDVKRHVLGDRIEHILTIYSMEYSRIFWHLVALNCAKVDEYFSSLPHLPSPRVFKTHLPIELLPHNLLVRRQNNDLSSLAAGQKQKATYLSCNHTC